MSLTLELENVLLGGNLSGPSDSGDSKIYFLVSGDEVIYVGQTLDLNRRAYQHSRPDLTEGKVKSFDNISFIECSSFYANNVEAFYIAKFTPIFNKIMPKNDIYRKLSTLKVEIGTFAFDYVVSNIDMSQVVDLSVENDAVSTSKCNKYVTTDFANRIIKVISESLMKELNK